MKINAVSSATLCLSLAGILWSYGAEILMGFTPCQLCLVQRHLLISTAIASTIRMTSKWRAIGVSLEIASISFLLVTSIYHLSVQYGLLSSPCLSKLVAESPEGFFNSLSQTKPCKRSMLSLLGIPAPLISTMLFSPVLFHRIRQLAANDFLHREN